MLFKDKRRAERLKNKNKFKRRKSFITDVDKQRHDEPERKLSKREILERYIDGSDEC